MRHLLTATALVSLTVLASCVSRGSDSGFTSLPASGWAYGDTLLFDVARADSLAPVELRVAVRNNNDFPYSNLWLEVTYTDGRLSHRDTVNMPLADVYGRWIGKGFGAQYQSDAVVATHITPPNGSRIGVRHVMRTDTLTGLEQVGITLTAL